MQNAKFFLLIVLLSISMTSRSQEVIPTSFIELSTGYGWANRTIYSVQFILENKPKKWVSSSYNIEYNITNYNGGYTLINPGSTSTNSFIVKRKSWYINYLWHPIRTLKQPYSLLFLGVGIGHYQQVFGNILDTNGPALRSTVGSQYVFFEKLSVSIKFQMSFIFYNLNMDDTKRFKYSGDPIKFSLGYRF